MLRLGGRQWQIYRQGERRPSITLRNRFEARNWLLQFKGDALSMGALRRLLSHQGSLARRLDAASDDEVIEQAAALLGAGLWHVHEPQVDAPSLNLQQSARDSGAKKSEEPAPPQPQRPPATPKAADSDSPTFSSKVDAAALAGVLAGAADQGIPFCPI